MFHLVVIIIVIANICLLLLPFLPLLFITIGVFHFSISLLIIIIISLLFIEGSLEVKLPTIWTDEKQSREEAERRGRLEERKVEEKE